MKVGLNKYQHEAGECHDRKIATLSGPCGDPRCTAGLKPKHPRNTQKLVNGADVVVNMTSKVEILLP